MVEKGLKPGVEFVSMELEVRAARQLSLLGLELDMKGVRLADAACLSDTFIFITAHSSKYNQDVM